MTINVLTEVLTETHVSQNVIFVSDTHFADRSKADDFWKNEATFKCLLENEEGLMVYGGDIFELWQSKLPKVVQAYTPLIRQMLDRGGILLNGNHDYKLLEWKDIFVREDVVVGNVLFTHGYQPDPWSGKYRVVGRSFSWLGGVLERIGWKDIDEIASKMRALRNRITPSQMTDAEFDRIKQKYIDWACGLAKEQGCKSVVFGHTHRPGMESNGAIHVFNAGSWVKDVCTFVRVKSDRIELCEVVP